MCVCLSFSFSPRASLQEHIARSCDIAEYSMRKCANLERVGHGRKGPRSFAFDIGNARKYRAPCENISSPLTMFPIISNYSRFTSNFRSNVQLTRLQFCKIRFRVPSPSVCTSFRGVTAGFENVHAWCARGKASLLLGSPTNGAASCFGGYCCSSLRCNAK